MIRSAVLRRLNELRFGRLTIDDRGDLFEFGNHGEGCEHTSSRFASDLTAMINVIDDRFYRSVVLGGALGAAESYIRGDWNSPDLTATMRVLARNMELLGNVERGPTRLLLPLRSAANWFLRNTREGSRRNIAAHYDLSNEFFFVDARSDHDLLQRCLSAARYDTERSLDRKVRSHVP